MASCSLRRRGNTCSCISNSSGAYFHLMLLNALMALTHTCWLLFSGIDWVPLRSHQRFNASACQPVLSGLSSSSCGHLRACSLACTAVPKSDTACPKSLAAICQRRCFSSSCDILVPVLPPSQHFPVHTAFPCPHPTVSWPLWFNPTPWFIQSL